MNNNDFSKRQQKAIEEMLKMNEKSQNKSPEKPPQKQAENQPTDFLSGLNIPFLSSLKSDGDLTLVLGLLLLLLNEKADKRLLFALLYILL